MHIKFSIRIMIRKLLFLFLIYIPIISFAQKQQQVLFNGVYLGMPKSIFMKKVNRILNYKITYYASYGKEYDLLQIWKFENYCKFKNNKLETLVLITPFDYKKRGDNTHDPENTLCDVAKKRIYNHLRKKLNKNLSIKIKEYSKHQYSAEYRFLIWITCNK